MSLTLSRVHDQMARLQAIVDKLLEENFSLRSDVCRLLGEKKHPKSPDWLIKSAPFVAFSLSIPCLPRFDYSFLLVLLVATLCNTLLELQRHGDLPLLSTFHCSLIPFQDWLLQLAPAPHFEAPTRPKSPSSSRASTPSVGEADLRNLLNQRSSLRTSDTDVHFLGYDIRQADLRSDQITFYDIFIMGIYEPMFHLIGWNSKSFYE